MEIQSLFQKTHFYNFIYENQQLLSFITFYYNYQNCYLFSLAHSFETNSNVDVPEGEFWCYYFK